MRIGITISKIDNLNTLFLNGVRQNAIFFADILKEIEHDVFLVSTEAFDFLDYKVVTFEELTTNQFDIIFQFSLQIPNELLLHLHNDGVKLVSYNCGNDYALDTEMALFGKFNDKLYRHTNWNGKTQYTQLNDKIFDQIWSIPQMSKQNLSYWKTLYRTDCIEVPFIWSPKLNELMLIELNKIDKIDFNYQKRNTNKVAIFEPNINAFKWCYPALLVCENAFRSDSTSLGHVFVTNVQSNERFNIDFFNELVKPLDLYRFNKLSIESRWNSLYFMSRFADIAVSFQHENPLNYLYLDLAWWGWPVVHNAHLCKDIGYYYPDFDFQKGGEILLEVVKNHDINSEKYLEENRKLISRYLPTNKKLQKKYKDLIEGLFR